MARLLTNGFETGSFTSGIEWTTCNGATASVQGTTVRGSGNFAGKILNPTSGSPTLWAHQFGGNGDLYYRFYIKVVTAPNVNTTIFFATSNTNSTIEGTGEAHLILKTDGTLQLRNLRGGHDIGSPTSAINDGQWHMVEVRDETIAGSNTVTGRLDGVQFATSGTEGNSGVNAIKLGANLQNETCSTGEWYFDDVAVNDASGADQNSWPGEGAIFYCPAASAGDFAEGAAGGTSPAATGWQSVSDLPPDDGTTYWEVTNGGAGSGSADRLDVGIAAFTPSAASITLVHTWARFSNSTASACNHILRLKGQSSGTVTESSPISANVTTWNTLDDTASARAMRLTRTTNPQTSSGWAVSDMSGIQVGYRKSTTSTTIKGRVTAIGAMIEYVPGASGTNHTVTVSDSVGITDSVGRVAAFSRSVADPVGVTDAVSRTAAFVRSVADSVGITDAAGAARAIARAVSDVVGATDSVTPSRGINRSVSDAVGITDAVARAAAFSRTVSDPVGIADTLVRTAAFVRGVTDSVGIADSTGRVAAYVRSLSDPVAIVDTIVRVAAFVRSVSDGVSVTDLATPALTQGGTGPVDYAVTISDVVGITDSVNRVVAYVRNPQDAVGIADAVSKVSTFVRQITDGVAVTDSTGRAVAYQRSQADVVGISDSVVQMLSGATALAFLLHLLIQSVDSNQ